MTGPILAITATVLLAAPAESNWKPARGPLMTRWAKDVRADAVLPEYPRPQMERTAWQNLNGLWQMAFAKADEAPPLGKELSAQILVPFPVESALSGVMKHTDRLWYRRTFSVPKAWTGRVLLHFGAVDWEATVYVDGHKLGTHQGGFDPFTFDITDALKKDAAEHELVVGVFDPTNNGPQPRGKQVLKPSGIYYTPCTGIWQTVWLESVPASYIEGLKITPDVDAGCVRVTVTTKGDTAGQGVRLTASLKGKRIGSVEAKPGEEAALKIDSPQLWSPETPTLYDLQVELTNGDKSLDRVKSYFGMRKIEVKPVAGSTQPRILLNGKPVFQMGVLDQGFWPDGIYTAPTDEALRWDVEFTKKLGLNMSRKHVKVEPARWYYWCDKLGLLVWQDMPSGDRGIGPKDADLKRSKESAAIYERELRRMMDSFHNHPSIIGWVIFNEGWGQFDTVRLAAWTKKHDPSRLVDSASGWTDRGVGDVHDVHVYPGPGAPPPEEKRAAFLGEFGGLGLGIDGHTWTGKTWGYRGTRDKADLTRKYERLVRGVYELEKSKGLSGAVYTQLTDVETEANGLTTYDRAVTKVDLERVAAANRGDFTQVPALVVVVPTAQTEPQTWRYTTERPGKGWYKADFAAEGWKEGKGGFGTKMTPGAVIGTEWNGKEIWIRRSFELPGIDFSGLSLLIHHDEDAEVYLNGVLAARLTDFTSDYEEASISPEALKALKPGKNVIAIHCRQTRGGQYIDAGLVGLKAAK